MYVAVSLKIDLSSGFVLYSILALIYITAAKKLAAGYECPNFLAHYLGYLNCRLYHM